MSEMNASFLVCDDLLFSMNGKVVLQGIYTQDVVIPGDELQMQQLVFFFILRAPKTMPIQKIQFRIEIPGSPPSDSEFPIGIRRSAMADDRRKSVTWRHPVLLQQPILRPGRISTSVMLAGEKIDAGGIWVITMDEAQKAAQLEAQ